MESLLSKLNDKELNDFTIDVIRRIPMHDVRNLQNYLGHKWWQESYLTMCSRIVNTTRYINDKDAAWYIKDAIDYTKRYYRK